MNEKKEIYFNFPVTMLQGAFKDVKKLMDSIMDYAVYVHAINLDLGTDEAKMKAAWNYFDMENSNVDHSYVKGQFLLSRFPSNLPMVGISHAITFDYFENYKSDYEIAVLCAYLAIKSILGSKPYTKTTNDYLICRMAGYSKIDETARQLPAPLLKFTTRRMLDKIKMELQTGWNVNIYAKYTRGFYVSIDAKFPLEKLVLEAEKRREKHIQAELRDRVERARVSALETLKTTS